MKLLDAQVNADSLAELGIHAVRLLCGGDIDTLASRYGYALSYGRDPATAIREHLKRCLSEIGAASLAIAPELPLPTVSFFKQPDSSNLVAAVELLVPADNGAALQVALVVTTDGTAHYVTLEGIDAFTPAQ